MSKSDTNTWRSLSADGDETDVLVRLSDLTPPSPDAYRPLWWDLVYPSAVSVLAGPPSIGKTTFARRIVATIATGDPAEFLGWPGPRTGRPVLVIDFETPPAEHYQAWSDAFSDHPEAMARVHLCQAESHLDLELTARCVRDLRVGLVVIDTLSAAFNFKEISSNSETEDGMKKLRRLARSTDAAVLVLAHSPKGRTDLLGAQAQKAAADVVKFYEPHGSDSAENDQYRISGYTKSGVRGKSRFGEIRGMTFRRSGAGHFDLAEAGTDQESAKDSVVAVAGFLRGQGEAGATTAEVTQGSGYSSRTTVLNAIRDLRREGRVRVEGKGKSTRLFYVLDGEEAQQ